MNNFYLILNFLYYLNMIINKKLLVFKTFSYLKYERKLLYFNIFIFLYKFNVFHRVIYDYIIEKTYIIIKFFNL